jgi:hypothetical protein
VTLGRSLAKNFRVVSTRDRADPRGAGRSLNKACARRPSLVGLGIVAQNGDARLRQLFFGGIEDRGLPKRRGR